MSTRAVISVRQPHGGFTAIYVHMQGEQTLDRLRHRYAQTQQVEALIKLGDLSSIGDSPAECVAYHRDENEPWYVVRPQVISRSDHLARHALELGAEYIYVFSDGQWSVHDVKYLAHWSSRHRRYFQSKALLEALAA